MLLVTACSCLNQICWSQVVRWEWRCSWSSADRRCSNYIWVINNLFAYQSASYIRDSTVVRPQGRRGICPVSYISTCEQDELESVVINFDHFPVKWNCNYSNNDNFRVQININISACSMFNAWLWYCIITTPVDARHSINKIDIV